MKQLFEAYNELAAKAEEIMYQYVLPPVFRVMLFGMKLTLIWAFYQTFKNVVKDSF